jgi:PH (Pleckstrin Homology) domain-containing protein
MMTSYQTESRVAREIGAGERLLWSGRPRQGLMLRPADALLIPFSLLWGGFAFFWEGTAISAKAPFFFLIWGIPFVLIGLYLIAGRFFADARQRERTIYAVTNERIIIISGLFKETVKSLNLKTLSDISLSEQADGTGTVSLGPSLSYAWLSSGGWPGGRQNLPPAFEGIPNARTVYDLIRQAQKAAA